MQVLHSCWPPSLILGKNSFCVMSLSVHGILNRIFCYHDPHLRFLSTFMFLAGRAVHRSARPSLNNFSLRRLRQHGCLQQNNAALPFIQQNNAALSPSFNKTTQLSSSHSTTQRSSFHSTKQRSTLPLIQQNNPALFLSFNNPALFLSFNKTTQLSSSHSTKQRSSLPFIQHNNAVLFLSSSSSIKQHTSLPLVISRKTTQLSCSRHLP